MFRQSWYLRCYKKVNTSKNSTIVQLKNIDASVLLINSSLISCKGHAIAVRRRSSSNEWLKIRARSNFLLHRLFLLHLLVFTASVQMLKLLLLNAGLDHISIRIALVLDQMIMLLMKKRILCYCICESNTPSLQRWRVDDTCVKTKKNSLPVDDIWLCLNGRQFPGYWGQAAGTWESEPCECESLWLKEGATFFC